MRHAICEVLWCAWVPAWCGAKSLFVALTLGMVALGVLMISPVLVCLVMKGEKAAKLASSKEYTDAEVRQAIRELDLRIKADLWIERGPWN